MGFRIVTMMLCSFYSSFQYLSFFKNIAKIIFIPASKKFGVLFNLRGRFSLVLEVRVMTDLFNSLNPG